MGQISSDVLESKVGRANSESNHHSEISWPHDLKTRQTIGHIVNIPRTSLPHPKCMAPLLPCSSVSWRCSAPLVDQIRPQVWKKGQLAYWERMAVRVNILHQTSHKKVASDLASMLNTLSANATEDMEQDLFATLLRTWIKAPHNDPTEIKGYIHNQELQALAMSSSKLGQRRLTHKAFEDSSGS